MCVSPHRQLSWHRKTPFPQKRGACRDSKAAASSISHSSWMPPPRTQNLALCWPASPPEGAAFTTKTQQHCPQMCREQTPRGPTCVSSKLLLGCWELASRTLSRAFWVRAQNVLAVWLNRATMNCLESLQKQGTGVPTADPHYNPSGQSQHSKGQFLIWKQWQVCFRYSKKSSMLKKINKQNNKIQNKSNSSKNAPLNIQKSPNLLMFPKQWYWACIFLKRNLISELEHKVKM